MPSSEISGGAVAGLVLLIGLTAAAPGPVTTSRPVAEQKKVLVLYSAGRDAQIATVGDRELRRVLFEGLSVSLDYYSEFIDQSRYSDGDYLRAFRDFLGLKYKGHRFDLVVAMDHLSLDFVDRTRADLFAATPVVFFSSRVPLQRPANATGVHDPLKFTGSLELALTLQPDLRNVFVVSGADAAYETAARAQFQPFESRVSFTYLSRMTLEDLQARVATLPPHSIVYYLHFTRDSSSRNFNAIEFLDRIVAAANVPTYSWVDSAMDHGIVGGSLRSLTAQSAAVATLALRVLRGEDAGGIPLASPDLNVSQVDARQLARWGIGESRVPVGTQVRFREPSIWERDKGFIVAALALILAQTILIAGLLVQRLRRRQAEAHLRVSQDELRGSYERIRDLGGRLLHAQETERSRIARELHDDIGQQVALLTIDLEMLRTSVPDDAESVAFEVLARAQSIARGVHDLSHRLHPVKLRLIGLVPALYSLQREVTQSEIAIRFTHEHVPQRLPPDLMVGLFRVVQEALQNALKYSKGGQIAMHLEGRQDTLALTIVDDGVGFDVKAGWGKGLGLLSMAERVEAIGGRFEVHSAPGRGTRLEVVVPIGAVTEEMKEVKEEVKEDEMEEAVAV